jgi:ubiquinone/menaquinone biosynthesis C-methylase UbiE
MDSPEEAASYDAMDHEAVNSRFVIDFLESHGPMRGGRALDVGTGTARIPIQLCRADPGARVLGIDLAAHMLRIGSHNIAKAGLADRITLERIDAKGLPYADESFEAVISNSIVHHIPEPGFVLAEMVRVVAPDGTLFVRDLARPPSRERLDQLVETYAGQEPADARALFAASLRAALTVDEVRALVRSLGLPDDGATMTSDRHWTWVWHREN